MKREELLYKLTGTETPLFISERENVIIDKCLNLINNLESEVKNLDIQRSVKRSANATAYNDGYSKGYADALIDSGNNSV